MPVQKRIIILSVILVLLILCACFASVIYFFVLPFSNSLRNYGVEQPTKTQEDLKRNPILLDPSKSGDPTSGVWNETDLINPEAYESLLTLKNTVVKENDPYDIARRYEKKTDLSTQVTVPPKDYKSGDERDFWVLDTMQNTYSRVTAVMQYETAHSYFWISKDVSFNREGLVALAQAFEEKIYPTNRAFFGSEWTPGIDNDPHVFILYARGMGNAAGFFSSTDTVINGIDEYSNMAEMIYISADYVDFNDEYAYGVLAHEFQHMIQWNGDRNETSWITEGFSELAMYLNGYDPGGFDYLFAFQPNLQLTDWPGNDQGDSSPHYGAAFMFMKYFLDRFGEDATQGVVKNDQNDLDSVDLMLENMNLLNPISQARVTADEVFRDWTVTNLINDGSVSDGQYQYIDYQPPVFVVENISVPIDWRNESVKQYGTNYYQIDCPGGCGLSIEGKSSIQIIPENPHSGKYYFWSNKGDESDMTLTQTFDFSKVNSPISIQYYTWFAIERDYDYLYLLASEDGINWEILKTPSCTQDNPTGANYGCGYSSRSNGWVLETVDLSRFAGKKVTLQFEYITDLAVNGEGLLLDDISIDAIGYHTDFEVDSGGWISSGFVRIQNLLPQEYLITLIKQGLKTEVIPMYLDENFQLEIPLSEGADYHLVISGITRYTRIPAEYRIRVN